LLPYNSLLTWLKIYHKELGMRSKEGGRIKTTEDTELHGGRIRKEGRKVVFHHLFIIFLSSSLPPPCPPRPPWLNSSIQNP
jgi:hypothetical protein